MSEEFVDHYEVLELSRNASRETIERVFRFRAKHLHPDANSESDVTRFSQIVEAYETLSDPELRAAFDAAYDAEQLRRNTIIEDSGNTQKDTLDRLKLLSMFYAQRRRDMRNPGMGIASLEQMLDCPQEILEFHLWYFREKGWIQREESGQLAITADGVDQIESKNEQMLGETRLITRELDDAQETTIIKPTDKGDSVSELVF